MTALARDNVASDHLVYAWPFPIGPECDVTCGSDEQVVMCPAWVVGERLGPGRHHWRTPDPSRPVAAYFVLVEPVEVPFDVTTQFVMPSTGQQIRLRATGTMQVRCADPGLLVAQFVGLPFDSVNDGVMRSVSRSAERMIARLLTRRVVMAGTPLVVTDATMQQGIIEEVVAYNPTAGAVFGIEMIRLGQLAIHADDGQKQYATPNIAQRGNGNGSARPTPITQPEPIAAASPRRISHPPIDDNPTGPQMQPYRPVQSSTPEIKPPVGPPLTVASGEIGGSRSSSSGDRERATASGEIGSRNRTPSGSPPPLPKSVTDKQAVAPPPEARRAGSINVEMPARDEITQPSMQTPTPAARVAASPGPTADQARGSIMGIGMSQIGSGSVAGEIPIKVKVGARVLVPGPNGLMQSATVRQLLQGYYELEVGSSGETIWVPIGGVVPD